ncbi:MAG: SpoIID/LytB domain-containing protein [Clostridia bacterium]|nr:SpoIID/LytB domain-containing protein [Clostridia bacterium]
MKGWGKIFVALFLCLFLIINSWLPVRGANIPVGIDELKVAINTQISSAEFLICEGQYQLVCPITQYNFGTFSKDTLFIVVPVGNDSLQITINGQPVARLAGNSLLLKPQDLAGLNVFKFQGKRFRDTLLIENFNGKLNVINIIGVERYLYGVVGAEMGSNAPDEALKAQAVVSRTYALYHKENSKNGYDLGTNTNWQVYGGYDMEVLSGQRVKNAVDATRGQVIYYDNTLIQAFFHANAGGYTENSENVWSAVIPYIRAVPSPGDLYALHYPAQDGGWPANTYQWTKTFTLPELAMQLAAYNSNNPTDQVQVGNIVDIKISRQGVNPNSSPRGYLPEETPSGRVTELEIVGTRGSKTFFRDGIRSVFGLRSTLFDVFFDSTVEVLAAAQKAIYNTGDKLVALGVNGLAEKLNGSNSYYYVQDIDGVKTIPKTFSQITFNGRGYGHGLGMSQWGARGMAAQGYNYLQIIQHYYNNNNYDGKLNIRVYSGQTK